MIRSDQISDVEILDTFPNTRSINKYLESKFDDCKSIDCSLQLNKSWQCIASRYLVLVGTLGSTRDADSWD